MNRIAFISQTDSPGAFRAFAEKAAELGATHVFISDLPKSKWQWDLDRDDPYPNWGMMHSSLFKVAPPEALWEWIPASYSDRCFDIVAERGEVLRQLGLKAAFKGCEPAWLPEGVYRAHPDWRGARCEHPRRGKKSYYSLCIDNTEVLALYRDAVRRLCRAAPIELFTFLTNDSGGGICWSQGLYPGPNGPAACRHIPFSERVTRFLSVLQEGAAEEGLSAEVQLAGSIPQFEVLSAVPFLKEGQSVNGITRGGRQFQHSVGWSDDFYMNNVYPIRGIPHVVPFLKAASEVTPVSDNVTISVPDPEDNTIYRLWELCRENTPVSWREQVNTLYRLAEGEAGPDGAEDLVTLWNSLEAYRTAIDPIHAGGPLLLLGCVNQRWLTRPFVLHPLALQPEERDYYRRFQFQADTEEKAADLMDLQSYRLVSGHSGAYLASSMLDRALTAVQEALSALARLDGKLEDSPVRAKYRLLSKRLEALVCVASCAQNAVRFQEVLDRSDFTLPKEEPSIWHVNADQRLLELQEITRAEIDNTYRLISLLEETQEPLLVTAPSAEEEDIFLLNPDLPGQLRKKAENMLRHMQDIPDAFRRFN